MWLRMANEQRLYDLSERLMRAINNWHSFGREDDDVEQLIERGLYIGVIGIYSTKMLCIVLCIIV